MVVMVVRECYEDDGESLWKSLTSDPLATLKPLNQSTPKFARVIYVSDISLSAKFCSDRTRSFFLPIWVTYNSSRSAIISFLRASAMLKHVIGIGWTSVRLSVRHTLVLYQNG